MRTAGALLLVNPETRPTSFCPAHVDPVELDGLTQRMLLTAQANGRYPNFGGFCMGFDPCGFKVGGRRMLLIYWQWGNNTEPLRHYLQREDALLTAEFKKRTGYEWVTPEEYITYLLAIRRPDFAPIIDLPTKRWLEETAAQMPSLPPPQLAAFEQRLDAWSDFLMHRYQEACRRVRGLTCPSPSDIRRARYTTGPPLIRRRARTPRSSGTTSTASWRPPSSGHWPDKDMPSSGPNAARTHN